MDDAGEVLLGSPAGEGQATVLQGQAMGEFHVTQQVARVARLLPPIQPVNIFCIGLNYMDHAKEQGAELPANPVIFMKPTTCAIAHQDTIVIPRACEHGPEVDFEGELAVVIGKAARDVSEADALKHVLGYTVANDVSARRWQKQGGGGQWIRGKSFDTFCPLGPVLVTADEIPDPQTLAIHTKVSGKLMQQGHTRDMIFSVARIIAFVSRDTTLLPGTVILTGTPAGVGMARKPPVFLQAGDHVEIEIERIGKLSNPVRQA